MSELIEDESSSRDRLLIMANQLGRTLAVYRLRPSYIRLLQRIGWLLIIMGIIILIVSALWLMPGFQKFQFALFFSSLFGGVLGLLSGGICLRILVLQAQQEHIIVCEQGLLRIIGTKYAEAVRWTEIQTAEKAFFDFSIVYKANVPPWMKTLHISSFCQNFDELIALIRNEINKRHIASF